MDEIKDKEMPIYFPTQVGARWVYLHTSEDKDKKEYETIEEVTQTEDAEGGSKIVTVGFFRLGGNEPTPNHVYEVSPHGTYWIKNLIRRGDIDRGACVLKLPHIANQTWSYVEGKQDKASQTLTAKGPEKIKVPGGEFEAIRVEYRDERSKEPSQTRWYAPDIGLVKVEYDNNSIVLKSFLPIKSEVWEYSNFYHLITTLTPPVSTSVRSADASSGDAARNIARDAGG